MANDDRTQSRCTHLRRNLLFSVKPAEFIINKRTGYTCCWVVPCLGSEVDVWCDSEFSYWTGQL